MAEYVGCKYAVGLSCGTAALHMATKLAGERLYSQARPNEGTLKGKKVFCSDVTFDASINPVAYEDGEAVFIDTEQETWNMSPEALEKAFELYPDVRLTNRYKDLSIRCLVTSPDNRPSGTLFYSLVIIEKSNFLISI